LVGVIILDNWPQKTSTHCEDEAHYLHDPLPLLRIVAEDAAANHSEPAAEESSEVMAHHKSPAFEGVMGRARNVHA
jgi:hypothetical protein